MPTPLHGFMTVNGERSRLLVYVHEILRTPKGGRLRNLGDLYDAVSPSRVDEYEHISKAVEESDYPKLCFKMATGSGKTWVLQAALVWQYFNAIWPEEGSTEYSKHFLVVAPGLVVLERLLDSFLGKKDARGNRDVRTADLTNDLFIPVEWRTQFHLRILGPDDVNPSTSPEDGAFVLLLNWHKLAPREDRPNLAVQIFGQDQIDTSETFLAYLSSFPDLVIFNDEAHHVHDKARKGAETDVDARWLEAVKRLRAHVKSLGSRAGLFLQLDFSATPFFGAGMRKEYFPHIVYDYDLKLAMNGYSPIQKKDVPLPLSKATVPRREAVDWCKILRL